MLTECIGQRGQMSFISSTVLIFSSFYILLVYFFLFLKILGLSFRIKNNYSSPPTCTHSPIYFIIMSIKIHLCCYVNSVYFYFCLLLCADWLAHHKMKDSLKNVVLNKNPKTSLNLVSPEQCCKRWLPFDALCRMISQKMHISERFSVINGLNLGA